MPNTTAWNLPYPTGTQVPNVPADILALANAVDTQLTNITADIGGEWKATGTQSVLISSGANLITMAGTTKAANGVTWNGSNQVTIVTAGLYSMTVSSATGFAAGNNWSCAVGGASAPGTGVAWVVAPTFSAGQTASGVSGTRFLAAGAIVRPYFYNNGSAVTLDATGLRPSEFSIWKVG